MAYYPNDGGDGLDLVGLLGEAGAAPSDAPVGTPDQDLQIAELLDLIHSAPPEPTPVSRATDYRSLNSGQKTDALLSSLGDLANIWENYNNKGKLRPQLPVGYLGREQQQMFDERSQDAARQDSVNREAFNAKTGRARAELGMALGDREHRLREQERQTDKATAKKDQAALELGREIRASLPVISQYLGEDDAHRAAAASSLEELYPYVIRAERAAKDEERRQRQATERRLNAGDGEDKVLARQEASEKRKEMDREKDAQANMLGASRSLITELKRLPAGAVHERYGDVSKLPRPQLLEMILQDAQDAGASQETLDAITNDFRAKFPTGASGGWDGGDGYPKAEG